MTLILITKPILTLTLHLPLKMEVATRTEVPLRTELCGPHLQMEASNHNLDPKEANKMGTHHHHPLLLPRRQQIQGQQLAEVPQLPNPGPISKTPLQVVEIAPHPVLNIDISVSNCLLLLLFSLSK
jgi:hypothetical protein